jgi:hypothetical protein
MGERGFRLERKDWDSDFFGRQIYSLELIDTPDLAPLTAALGDLDAREVWGVECHLAVERFDQAPTIEEAGFRLVDSRMSFISEVTIDDIPDHELPYGLIRQVTVEDLDRIEELTTTNLVDNPGFRSRYKDRRLFTRQESIRYYDAWNDLAYRTDPDLFPVWEVDGEVAAYFTFLRAGPYDELPFFKGGLTAVDPAHRGHGAQNALQYFAFRRFGVDRWVLDSQTQITNPAVIRNHMRAQKQYRGATLTFYRLRTGLA